MANIKATTSNLAANTNGGTGVTGAQNGLNVTVTPGIVELGGQLIRDTTVEGFDGNKFNNMIWDQVNNFLISDFQNTFEVESQLLADGRRSRFFMGFSQILFRMFSTLANDRQLQMNFNNISPYSIGLGIADYNTTINFCNIGIRDDRMILDIQNNVNGPNLVIEVLPEYATVAAANADANLLSNALFRVTGDQIVYQKN